jgi:hypothetical protein
MGFTFHKNHTSFSRWFILKFIRVTVFQFTKCSFYVCIFIWLWMKFQLYYSLDIPFLCPLNGENILDKQVM